MGNKILYWIGDGVLKNGKVMLKNGDKIPSNFDNDLVKKFVKSGDIGEIKISSNQSDVEIIKGLKEEIETLKNKKASGSIKELKATISDIKDKLTVSEALAGDSEENLETVKRYETANADLIVEVEGLKKTLKDFDEIKGDFQNAIDANEEFVKSLEDLEKIKMELENVKAEFDSLKKGLEDFDKIKGELQNAKDEIEELKSQIPKESAS